MARRAIAIALLLAAPLLAAALTDKGVIYLDDLTFDKIVNGRDHVLVRFDREYPWGDAHDAFKELAAALGEAGAPVVVAGVPISNREEYLVNPRLAQRFALDKIKDDDFPKFRLFLKGKDATKPLAYTGAAKKDDLAAWIVDSTGVFVGKRGQIEPLDAAAKKLVAAKQSERPGLLEAAKKAASALDLAPAQKEFAEYYVKAMARVVEKGEGYVQKEVERLAKMAADKSVAPAKREAFEWKANILGGFLPAGKGSGKGGGSGGKKTEL